MSPRLLLLAALVVLAGCGTPEGTVVAKNYRGPFDYMCQIGSIPISIGNGQFMYMPIYGTCTAPECWKLHIRPVGADPRDAPDETCVDRAEYDAIPVGAFYHENTSK